MEIFGDFIPGFMQVFLDDFAVYSRHGEHLDHLRLCLEKCREYRLSLNLAKCVFGVASGNLLGHVVSREGIAVDPDKVKAIVEIQAQHRPSRLKKPRTESVGTDRLGRVPNTESVWTDRIRRFCTENRLTQRREGRYSTKEYILGFVVGAL